MPVTPYKDSERCLFGCSFLEQVHMIDTVGGTINVQVVQNRQEPFISPGYTGFNA